MKKTLIFKVTLLLLAIYALSSCTKEANNETITTSSLKGNSPNSNFQTFTESDCQAVIYSDAGNFHNTGLDFYSQDFNEDVLFTINNSNSEEQNKDYTKTRLNNFLNSPLMHNDIYLLSDIIRDSIITQSLKTDEEIIFSEGDFSEKQNEYFQLIESVLEDENNITFASQKYSNQNLINQLNAIENQILNDNSFSSCQKLAILVPLSVAKSSSMYWIEVVNKDESLGKNWFKKSWNKVKNYFKPNPNGPINTTRIIRVISMDYLGAKTGAKIGSIFGPKGTLIGGIVGGIGRSAWTVIKG